MGQCSILPRPAWLRRLLAWLEIFK